MKCLISQNKYFKEEYQRGDLKFATSAFHAYAHGWTSPNRCATKQHRVDAINLKSSHGNEIRCNNAACSTEVKFNTAQGRFKEALDTLQRLHSQDPTFTYGYFSRQWERQKATQLAAMDDCGAQEKLEQHLIALFDLEEQVKDVLNELSCLRRKRRGNWTEEEMALFLTLPASIVELDMVVEEVGVKAQALICVRLAKMRLYEAKVGIVEAQKKWDKEGQGTNAQKGLRILMNKKQLIFKRKWTCYQDQVFQFNSIWLVSRILCPSLDEAKRLPFEDIFWNVGALAHPTEKWAVDPGTIEGIQAFLQHRSCSEELQRIGRKTQQMVFEALKTKDKLDGLLALYYHPEDGGIDLIELLQPGQRIAKDVWDRSYGYTTMTPEEVDFLIQLWEGGSSYQ
ncbi:hypothetical protein DFH28DRAFT_1084793 [Melampsora americana]|nr:hypothetical protein DFH28DRAFT_1084793 [Melampsora americana]